MMYVEEYEIYLTGPVGARWWLGGGFEDSGFGRDTYATGVLTTQHVWVSLPAKLFPVLARVRSSAHDYATEGWIASTTRAIEHHVWRNE